MLSVLEEERIAKALEQGKPVEIRGYTLSDQYSDNLEFCLRTLLARLGRVELFPVVFAVAQELALWASLANMRDVYFSERNLDITNPDHVRDEENAFLASINRDSEYHYRLKARERGLQLHTRISRSAGGLTVEVTNNAALSPPLEEKLRNLLRAAMHYTNIMDYFNDYPEDQLGRGVGLAFAILMLKEEKLRPELMRLGQSSEKLVSRVEIPIEENFVSIRDRIERGEDIRPFEARNLLPDGLQLTDVVMVRCPVCRLEVDERVFFPEVVPDMIDINSVWLQAPNWQYDQGACASCLATYGL